MIPVEQVKALIEKHGYQQVLFHLPAGLMPKWADLAQLASQTYFSADPCFGACDVPLHILEKIGADAIITFGHSKPPGLTYPSNVHFIEVSLSFEPSFVPPFQKVGLVYVIQYREAAQAYARQLKKAGKQVIWGGKPGFMATHPAQVTGCDVSAAQAILDQVDAFVVCSDGAFHAQAVAELGKPTFNWLGEFVEPPRYPVALLSTAETIGVLVSTKKGQFNLKGALEAQQKLEDLGKQVFLAVGDTLTPEIDNFQPDFWVVTACPRIAQDRPKSAPLEAVNTYIKGLYK